MCPIGHSIDRVDGWEKVTGRARFTDDLSLPGMVYAKILHSPLPHARIRSLDASAAEALPGVVAVLTAADFEGLNPYFGHAFKDRPILAIDKVRFVGDHVACVAAVDEDTAVEALDLIQVEYEELPAVFSSQQAMAPGAPLVHDRIYPRGHFHGIDELDRKQDNICYRHFEETGDVEQGFAEADFVLENVFTFPSIYHYAMEPYSVLADFRPGELRLWAAAQHPYIVQSELAEIFGLSLNQVRLTVPYLGGGFGSKSYTKIEPLAAAMSRKAGCPVKLTLSIEEAVYTNRRHIAWCWIKTGVKRDGTIVAREAKMLLNTGAYADNGPRVAERVANRLHGPYCIANSRIESCAVYTNTPPCGSFRAIGAPQGAWASESQIDMIAEQMGWDPLELRLKNIAARGTRFRKKLKEMDHDLAGNLRLLAERLGWGEETPGRGKGIACTIGGGGAGPVSTAILRLHADGTVTAASSSTEMGQGVRTVLTQLISAELGLPRQSIRIEGGDTGATPFDRSTGASRSTTVMGTAIVLACADLKDQLRSIASDLLEIPADRLQFQEGRIHADDGRSMAVAEVVRQYFGMSGGELIGRGYSGPHVLEGRLANRPVFWEPGAGGMEVSLDRETGVVKVERFVSVVDAGRVINPRLCITQEEGAVLMGIGHTFFEELIFQEGEILNANLMDYRIPTFADVPSHVETILVENGDGPGPYGARGIGEAGLVPVAPAAARAIYQLTGRRTTEMPLTPEKVWRLLQEPQS